MLRFAMALAAFVGCSVLAQSAAAKPPTTSRALHQFFADEWERTLRDSPEMASYNGDKRYDDRWSDMSLATIAKQEAADRAALAKLHGFDRRAC